MLARSLERSLWRRRVALGVAFAAFVAVQYVAVSNWSFNRVGSDTNTGAWAPPVSLGAAPLRAMRPLQAVFLQPIKGAIDHTMAIRVSPPDTVFGRWLASADAVDGLRRWYLSYALFNSTIWALGTLLLWKLVRAAGGWLGRRYRIDLAKTRS